MKALFLILFVSFAQQLIAGNEKMFSDSLLEFPKLHITQIKKLFSYNEIGTFKNSGNSFCTVLENGYAKSKILNPEWWLKIKKNRIVTSIDIVFTKYPRKESDWITNYAELLAARLQELFKTDPDLNCKNIKWHLVLQTDCKTDLETRSYFHGIVIHSVPVEKNQSLVSAEVNSKNKFQASQKKYDTLAEHNKKVQYENESEFFEKNSFLYRPGAADKQKTKKLKMPDCPDFGKSKKRKKAF